MIEALVAAAQALAAVSAHVLAFGPIFPFIAL